MSAKGIIGGTLIVIGILAVGSVIAAAASIYFLRVKIVGDLQMKYDYRNTNMALLSFLRSTHEGKTMYKILGEAYVNDEDVSFIQDKLRLIGGKCFEFTVGEKIKLKEGSCKFKYTSSFLVPLPPGYEQKFVPVKLKVGV